MVGYGDEQDEVEIGPSGGISYKDIVLSQFRKITLLSNVEFRGGFYTIIQNKKGGEDKEVYVPDSREIYSNAVYALGILLISKFNPEMKTHWAEYDRLMKENKKAFLDSTEIEETVILGERFYEDTKEKISLETYKITKLEINQWLYSQLSLLLASINYMELGGGVY